MTLHRNISPAGWHGAKIDSGTLANRGVPETVGQLYFVDSGTDTGKLFIANGVGNVSNWSLLLDLNASVNPLTVSEVDNAPTVNNVSELVFPNGSLTDNGNGEVLINLNPALSVTNASGTTSLGVTRGIRVPDGTLSTNPSIGLAILDIPPRLTVREVDSNPSISATTLVFPNNALVDNGNGTVTVNFPSGAGLIIEEVDGTPSVSSVTRLIVPNGSLTDNGSGVVALSLAGTSLAVQEVDGSPDVSSVTRLIFPNGSVTNNNNGSVTISLAGGGNSINVSEQSLNLQVPTVTRILVPDGSLTDQGSGTVSLSFTGGANLTVREEDATPTVNGVTELRFPNASLTNNGSGSVSVTFPSGSSSMPMLVMRDAEYEISDIGSSTSAFPWGNITNSYDGYLNFQQYNVGDMFVDPAFAFDTDRLLLPRQTGMYEIDYWVWVVQRNTSFSVFDQGGSSFGSIGWSVYGDDGNFVYSLTYPSLSNASSDGRTLAALVHNMNGNTTTPGIRERAYFDVTPAMLANGAPDRPYLQFYFNLGNMANPANGSGELTFYLRFHLRKVT